MSSDSITKTQRAKQYYRELKDLGIVDFSVSGLVGKIWISSHEKAYTMKDLNDAHLSNIATKYIINQEPVPHPIALELELRDEERKREYGVHKAHCFMVVQPENEFMGCKYGDDKKCPIYKERPTCPHQDNILYGKTLRINKRTRVVNMFCTSCDSFGTMLEEREKHSGNDDWYQVKETWHEMKDYRG